MKRRLTSLSLGKSGSARQTNPRDTLSDCANESSFMNLLPTAPHLEGRERAIKNWKRVHHIVTRNRVLFGIRNQMEVEGVYRRKSILKPLTKLERLSKSSAFWKKVLSSVWTTFLALAVIYYVILVPIRFAYDITSVFYTCGDIIFDAVFLLVSIGALIQRHREIRKDALFEKDKSLFKEINTYRHLFSIAISIPWQFIDFWLIVFKPLRIIDVGVIFKVTSKITQIGKKSKLFTQALVFGGLLRLFLLLALILHVAACLWIWIARINRQEGDWLADFDPQNRASNGHIYIQSYFFMCQIISAVGYGDLQPDSNKEYLMVMALNLIKGFLYAQVFFTLRKLTFVLYDKEIRNRNEDDELYSWLYQRNKGNEGNIYNKNFSRDLLIFLKEVKRKNVNQIIKTNPLFWQLPFELQFQTLKYLFKPVLDQFQDFFEGLTQEFMMALPMNLVPLKIKPESPLFLDSQTCDGLYFIVEGIVQEISEEEERIVDTYSVSSVIGLQYLIFDRQPSTQFYAVSLVKGYYISKSSFLAVSRVRHADFRKLKQRAMRFFVHPESQKRLDSFAQLEAPQDRGGGITSILSIDPQKLPKPQIIEPCNSVQNGSLSDIGAMSRQASERSPINFKYPSKTSLMFEEAALPNLVVHYSEKKPEKQDQTKIDQHFLHPNFHVEEIKGTKETKDTHSDHSNSLRSSLEVKTEQNMLGTLGLGLIKSSHEVKASDNGEKSPLSKTSILSNIMDTEKPKTKRTSSRKLSDKPSKPKIDSESFGEHQGKNIIENLLDKFHKSVLDKDSIVKVIEKEERRVRDDFKFHDLRPDEAETQENDVPEELDSSTEIPTEGVFYDDLIVDEDLFSLREIEQNLNAKLCILRSRLKNLRSKVLTEQNVCHRGLKIISMKFAKSLTSMQFVG